MKFIFGATAHGAVEKANKFMMFNFLMELNYLITYTNRKWHIMTWKILHTTANTVVRNETKREGNLSN